MVYCLEENVGEWERVTDTQTLACGTKAKNTPSGLPDSEPEIDRLPSEIPGGVVGTPQASAHKRLGIRAVCLRDRVLPPWGFHVRET